jgi:dolichyl-diphosphooligosaccharide--protein glycosyltransferase
MEIHRLSGSSVKFLEKRAWLAVALLSLLALGLRTIPRADVVFQPGFVNFQESDAWFHVRVVENLIHHFPDRISVDPYLDVGPPEIVATGPGYDWLLGGVAELAGLGRPSESLLHVIAAWYPAVLGALIVPIVFLLGRKVFGLWAGLCAAAIIATLPGHFYDVSSLGFTDHHVMESLLSALFLFALLKALDRPGSNLRTILAGLTLGAYLLTFVGGAFFVAIVLLWAAYDRIRSLWPREEPAFSSRPLCVSFLIAAIVVAPFYRQLWMTYSVAILLLGAAGMFLLDRWLVYCQTLARPKTISLTGFTLAAAAAMSVFLLPGPSKALRSVIPFFLPSYFGTTGAVSELQALVFSHHAFTLLPAWSQFAGAYVLSVVALFLLAELAVKQPIRGATLVFVWGVSTFLLAMGQIRMTYYFAVAAAILSGYLVARIFAADPRFATRAAASAALVLGIFVPNIASVLTTDQRLSGVSYDWRQALDWIRSSTPEPFGDPAFYYANYRRDFADPPQAYSIMAWWDYGYWLEAVARRIPVSNPTQHNASIAASFFLSQSEDEALRILAAARSRYVVVNAELPLLMNENGTAYGDYPAFFAWDKTKRVDDYLIVVLEPAGDGAARPRVLYRPAYYRSMAVRLFVYGAEGVADPPGAVVAYFGNKGMLSDLRRFASAEEAQTAERACRAAGCILAGENPQISCVPLEPLIRLQPVFQSDSPSLNAVRGKRSAVQVYEVR